MRAAAIALLFFAQQVTPPTVGQIQSWHEAGQYQRVVDAAQGREEPRVVYLAGLAYLTLEQPDGGRTGRASFSTLLGRASDRRVGSTAAWPPRS